MQRDKALRRDGAFVMTATQAEAPSVRDRSAETGSVLKTSYLPPSEIVAAAGLVRQESGEVPQEDLVRAVARLLGFQRVGTELSAAIESALIAKP